MSPITAPIAVITSDDVGFVSAAVSAILTGRGFVPVNHHDPVARCASTIDECESTAIVCSAARMSMAAEIAALCPHVLRIIVSESIDDRERAQTMQTAGAAILEAAGGEASMLVGRPSMHDPGATVYAVYTSGSTGTPKGVPITSANLMPLLCWQQREFCLGPDTAMVKTLSLAFDFGLQELFSTICFGGVLHFVDDEVLLDFDRYFELLDEHRATLAYMTPSIALAAARSRYRPQHLQTVLLGGEALEREVLGRLSVSLGGQRVFNGYGPTEASINCAMKQTDVDAAGVAEEALTIPIGAPTGESCLIVVDEAGQRCPIGVPGELVIGGPGVSAGYIGHAEESNGRFIDDPRDPGAKLYRSGDRVRFLENGELEFLGRFDDQIKIRGVRIEPAEVEAVLQRAEGVARAVVVLRRGRHSRLVAYCVGDGETSLDPAELRGLAARHLPSQAVPDDVLILDRLPLTVNGKIDRSRLPAPSQRAAAADLPLTATEQALARLWQSMLEVSEIGAGDNFYELGGTSLNVVQMYTAAQRATATAFPLHLVLEAPTLRSLAAAIDDPRGHRDRANPPARQRIPVAVRTRHDRTP